MKHLNIEDTAAILDLSERHVRKMAKDGAFPGAYKRYHQWFIPIGSIGAKRNPPGRPKKGKVLPTIYS